MALRVLTATTAEMLVEASSTGTARAPIAALTHLAS
jgi:hypothetical protein